MGHSFRSSPCQERNANSNYPTQVLSTRCCFEKKFTFFFRSSGTLKPGEMCLVLGCPGSGCTTFLKAIANRREDFATVSGDVSYAGIDAKEMRKLYKGEVVYNEEGKGSLPFMAFI